MAVGFIYFSAVPVQSLDGFFNIIEYKPKIEMTITNQFELINGSASHRFLQAYPFLFGGIVVGVAILLIVFLFSYIIRGSRSKKFSYKGMSCEIAPLPKTLVYRLGFTRSVLKTKYPTHQPLMNELLAYARLHKNHFIGHAHGDTGLYKHTLSVIKKANNVDEPHKLLELAAAAHDLGKVLTFNGTVSNNKYHDVEGGKILRRMPGLEKLPYEEQMILMMAVTYQHHKDKMPLSIPSLDDNNFISLNALLSQLIEVDGNTTLDEKTEALEAQEIDIEETLYTALTELVKTASFYSSASGRKSSNVGYRWGNKLFLFEYMVREFLRDAVPEPVAKQLDLDISSAKRLSNGMKLFMNLLNDKGLLIHTSKTANGDTYELPVESAFWDVSSGDYDFKAMIVLDVNNELAAHLPQESPYPVLIKSPYRMSKAIKKSSGSDDAKSDGSGEDGSSKGGSAAFNSNRKSQNLSINDIGTDSPPAQKARDTQKDASEIIDSIDAIELINNDVRQSNSAEKKKPKEKAEQKPEQKPTGPKKKIKKDLPPNLF
jgi:hypothetical protein